MAQAAHLRVDVQGDCCLCCCCCLCRLALLAQCLLGILQQDSRDSGNMWKADWCATPLIMQSQLRRKRLVETLSIARWNPVITQRLKKNQVGKSSENPLMTLLNAFVRNFMPLSGNKMGKNTLATATDACSQYRLPSPFMAALPLSSLSSPLSPTLGKHGMVMKNPLWYL